MVELVFKVDKHVCPPKNWETRSWSGDGRRPSGALHATGVASWAHSIELVAPLPPLLHLQSGCGFLGLGGAG
ncbi:unnamed protein product [Microthlaspi erraticum]|uniref:Uncharacterized protein n=1 Tax=Microthlaspi erraticum TaxID=1685480 RepID=A0A6D2K341_9BRAS|nr:unnamed protein product [Microthlaspi erraticum]